MPKSNAERQADYRERKRRQLEEEGLPQRSIEEEPQGPPVADAEPEVGDRDVEHLLGLPLDAELTPEEEQALRDHFGYSQSEKRSRIERASAAEGVRRGLPDYSSSSSMTAALDALQAAEKSHADRTTAYRDSLSAKS